MRQRGFQNLSVLAFLLSLSIVCAFKIVSALELSKNGVHDRRALAEEDTPGVVEVEGGPPGVVWIVQLSDIHISKWVPGRGRALRKSLGHALKLIRPAIVLVTGDLTDAKNKDRTATRQDEGEWIEYRDSFQKVVDDSGIPLKNFYDLRGNHDKYGVPLFSPLDYHSTYSISARMNRSSLVQSVTVRGRDGRKHLFVGIDNSMKVGLRGPSNTFGHPTDHILTQLNQELRRWDEDTFEPVTKIVYGHFPMSFTASTETGKRPEEVMAKNNVSAYVCGHLHTRFGSRLYKHHKQDTGEFWEWEMGDWRGSRMIRVLAIDNGHTSFVDVELIPTKDTSEGNYSMPTIILQTYPLDSRFMLQSSSKASGDSKAATNSIRALVFSETTPVSVTARIYDFVSHPPKLVTESAMKLVEEGRDGLHCGAHYYTAPWERDRYLHDSSLKYATQILVEGAKGSISHSEMRFFSAKGEPGEFYLTALAFLVMGFRWETVFPVLLWSMVLLSLSILVVPKIYFLHLQKGGRYEEWVTSVFTPATDSRSALGKVVKVPFWVLLEGARNNFLWAGLMAYVLYLVFFPWFSGRILADDYPIGRMSVRGWTVKPSNADPIPTISGLGIPDIMGLVLPYLCGVLFPLLLMLSALSAERAACEFHVANLGTFQEIRRFKSEFRPQSDRVISETPDDAEGSKAETVPGSVREECTLQACGEQETLLSDDNEDEKEHQCRLCTRLVRKCLFVGCCAVGFIHSRLCSTILGAYGPTALVAAPAYAWGVPALLIFSLFQTSTIRSKPPRHKH